MRLYKMMIVFLVVLSLFVTGCIGNKQTIVTPEGTTEIENIGSGWCKEGTKITTNTPQGTGTFIIKGITTYKDKEVCEALYQVTGDDIEGGTMTQYYTKDGKYSVIVYKDASGDVVNEIEMNIPK